MFRSFKTIRWKLTFAFLIAFGIMIIAFSIIVYNSQSIQTRKSIDRAMEILAESINEEIQNSGLKQDIFDETKETYVPFTTVSQHYVEIVDSRDSIVLRSNQLGNSFIPVNKTLLESLQDSSKLFETTNGKNSDSLWDNKTYRILYQSMSYHSKRIFIIVAIPVENMKNYLNNFRLIFIFSIPLMLFLSAILGWILSKGAYGPIRQMIRKTNELTAENLNTRLAVNDSGDELAQLSVTLNNMIERLEKSFTSLKQFTSDASHELRTPLTILRGQLEVALEKQRESKEYETTLKQNLDEVIRLQFIVDELLILSQLESGKLNIVKENINIIELITDTVSKINYLAKKKNIKVILNIKLDENNHNASINGDKAKLQNVFFNLLDNSIKYSFENSDINCTISHNYKENAVEVAIEDKGVGIAPGDIDKIFDRFYRADTSRTRDNSISLGLGLSIAKKIVEIHGGKLKVYSQLGAGSTFYVIFPQA